MSWLRRLWRELVHAPDVLPPPDRSVKRPAEVASDMAVLRAKRQREA